VRLVRLGIAVAIAAVCTAAYVDHRDKAARLKRAHVALWFCQHHGTRCGSTSPSSIEAAWNRRELGYGVAVVLLAGGGILSLRRPAAHRSEGSAPPSGE
jgi:hypothetical protein